MLWSSFVAAMAIVCCCCSHWLVVVVVLTVAVTGLFMLPQWLIVAAMVIDPSP